MTTKVEFHIVLPTGIPAANTDIEIQLAQAAYGADDGITMPRPVTVTTDDQGRVAVELWPSTTLYYLTAYDAASDASIYYKFLVPTLPAGSAVRFQDIVIDAPMSGATYDDAALLAIFDAKANARASELGAKTSADTAAGSATSANVDSGLAHTAAAAAASSASSAQVSASSAAQSATLAAAIAATTVNGLPVNPVTLTGTPGVGNALHVVLSTGWSVTGYQWLRDGTPIAGETSSTYIQQTADIGKEITCAVTGLSYRSLGITVPGAVVIQNLHSATVLTPKTILRG